MKYMIVQIKNSRMNSKLTEPKSNPKHKDQTLKFSKITTQMDREMVCMK